VVTVEPKTSITSQTNTPITQCEGGSFSLNVAATGLGTLSYQWYLDGNPITGATSSTYSVASSTASQTGSYTVKVTSSATKCASTTSSPVSVTINAQPTITVQPTNQTTCAGGNVTLSLTATSAAPIFYQWQVLNGATWTDIPTATTNPFSYGPITAAANGAQIRAIVSSVASGSSGVCPVTSNAFTLTVNTNTSIGAFTADQTICAGSALTMSVSANGSAPFTYKWYKNGSPVQTTSNVSATSDTYTVASASASDAGTYTVDVTSGCGTVTTNPGSVVKVNSVAISTQPVDQTVCSNGNATFSVAATVGTGPASYQWQLSTGGAFADIGGATSSSLSLTGVTTAMSGNKYQVIIKDNGSCPKTSNAVTLTVNTATTITTISTDQTLCVGDNLSLSVTAGGTAPYTYEWSRGATIVQTNTNVASNTDTYTVGTVSSADAGSYTVKVTSACGPITSSPVNVAVNGVTITGQPQGLTICGGNDATFTVAATGAGNGLSYQWQVKSGAGSFTDIAGATSASYTVTAATSAVSGNQYQVIVKDNNSCAKTSNPATLTVNGAMTINSFSTDNNLCVGAALNLSISITGTAPFTYDWYNGTNLVQSTPNVTALTDVYNVAAVAASDKGAYTVKVTSGCGTMTSTVANIGVNGVTISADPQTQTVCSGDSPSFSVSATAATGPLMYQWQVDDNTGGGFKDISGETAASLSISNAQVAQNGYKYLVKITDNGSCGKTSAVANLAVNASPIVTSISSDQTPCVSTPLNLSITVSGTAPYSFVWKKGGSVVSSTTNTTTAGDSYSVGSVSASDAGQYTVDITSACGTFTSNPINVVVNGVTITTQPVASVICETANTSFTVAATGISNPLTYQWQSDNGTGTYSDIAGATSATLTLNNVAASSNNYNYQVLIKDNGACQVASTAANLTVNPATIISQQPQGATLCEPAPLNLSVTATGSGALQYEWFKGTTSVQGPSSDNTYIVAATTVNDAGSYTVKVTGGCGSKTSTAATIIVNPAADPNKTLSIHSICKTDSDAPLIINNSQSGITYTAYVGGRSAQGVGNGVNLSVDINTQGLAAGSYTVTVKAQGCESSPVPLNNTATLTIMDTPGAIAGSATVCKSSNTGVSYSIGTVLGASTYTWAITPSTGGTITAGQGTSSISVDFNTASPVTITVTPMTADGNNGCGAPSITVTQLNAYVPETIVADKDTICAGTTVTFSVPNGSEPTYIWTFVSDGSTQTTSSSSISKTFNNAGDVMVFVTTHGHPCHADTTLLLANPVHVVGFPVANAGPDQELTNYQAITLDGSGSSKGSDYIYTWTSSNGTIASPNAITTSAMPTELESSYTLTVAAKSPSLPRCMASDEVKVDIRLIVTIPNIFSPNGDNNHDVVVIQNIQFFPKSVLYVYNQWGELIYKSQGGYPTPWDGTRGGTECAIGAYYYVLELNENNYKPLSGSITLVR
jgi:gliding motility-associated-like protein